MYAECSLIFVNCTQIHIHLSHSVKYFRLEHCSAFSQCWEPESFSPVLFPSPLPPSNSLLPSNSYDKGEFRFIWDVEVPSLPCLPLHPNIIHLLPPILFHILLSPLEDHLPLVFSDLRREGVRVCVCVCACV